ncbi:hypothetical protein VPH166E361_0090 [Vibrio phage 166E36-1]
MFQKYTKQELQALLAKRRDRKRELLEELNFLDKEIPEIENEIKLKSIVKGSKR